MTTRTVMRLTVELAGPWLVGDPAGPGEVDTVPLREPDGTPQVPATSLAGSLRDHLCGWPGVTARDWMGDRHRGDDDRGRPSSLRVLGVRANGGERSVRRTTTAVNRRTGSARRAALRREEHVDAPTTLTVYLTHDGEPDPALLDAIAAWRPVVGRRRTNGWGRAALTAVRYGLVDLRDREQLVTWLAGGGPSLVDALATVPVEPRPVGPAHDSDLLSVRCAVLDGLHIGSGEPVDALNDAGREPDRAVRVAGTVTRGGAAYVPASSWRGVFRGHAGFILRSLGLPDAQAEQRVAQLFGSVEHRGRLTFHDAALEEPESADHWHVGIDRITGGASPGLLFAERTVRGTLRLRISADHPDEVPGWARNLLRHTVRDIADGFLAVGGRTTRGLGTLTVLDSPPAPGGIDIGRLAPAGEGVPE